MTSRERSRHFDQMVAAKLKAVRESLGLTQKEFWEPVGVSFQQGQKYLNGVNRTSSGTLLALAEAHKISVGLFLDYDVNPAIWQAGYVQACIDCEDAVKIKRQMMESK